MDKTEEKLNITIEEEPYEDEYPQIREETIELFTGDRNSAEAVTEYINGFLEGFIITTNKNIQIQISLEDNPDIVLFDVVDYSGSKFIPLRVKAIDEKNDIFNLSHERFALSDNLRIIVKGNIDTEVKIKVRWC
jgi:hypothetical protein